MAVDAMEIDSNPISTGPIEPEKERKRKHKHKDKDSSSPSKKKRKSEDGEKKSKKDKSKSKEKKSSRSSSKSQSKKTTAEDPASSSPYTLTTATLYLPLSPISISPTHALASLLAEHLSPLLLTYYPPLQGIVLAYSNASISSSPPSASSPSNSLDDLNPQPLTLATTAGEYGVMYIYLTATFLVFRPQRGHTLEGWVNVQSEGFLGAVVLNLFSVGIERKRLPANWKWIPPGEEEEEGSTASKADQPQGATTTSDEDDDDSTAKPSFDPEKEHFKPVTLASDINPLADTIDAEAALATDNTLPMGDDDAAVEGYFQSVSGHRVRGTIQFRVVDVDVIPGTERDRGFLSIEGTMLSPEEEAKVVEDERNGIITSSSTVPSSVRRSTFIPVSAMSGALVSSVDVELDSPSKKMKGKVRF